MKTIRTPLAEVRGLGSAKNGTHHWWMQRVTAIALIPLVIWFVISLLCTIKHGNTFTDMFSSPFNTLAMVLLIGTSLHHGRLGMQVIIEDYVHCPCAKTTLLLGLRFVNAITALAGVFAVVLLHINTLAH